MNIAVKHISKSFDGNEVLRDFSYSFRTGNCYYICGQSGCGKTTLFRILTGLEKADTGTVDYQQSDRHEDFGVVFQENILLENFSAVENIDMTCRSLYSPIHPGTEPSSDISIDGSLRSLREQDGRDAGRKHSGKKRKKQKSEAIRRELCKVLPADSLDKPVKELSGGMRRRVCIVRAVLSDSGTLVMDEPFAGLDAETAKRCMDYILNRRSGRLLIMTGHKPDFYRGEEFIRVCI